MRKPGITELAILFTNIKTHRIATEVICRKKRSAASVKRVNNQLTFMCKKAYELCSERNRKGCRVYVFFPDISFFVVKLPDPKLAFHPFFCGKAVKVVEFTLTYTVMVDWKFLDFRAWWSVSCLGFQKKLIYNPLIWNCCKRFFVIRHMQLA